MSFQAISDYFEGCCAPSLSLSVLGNVCIFSDFVLVFKFHIIFYSGQIILKAFKNIQYFPNQSIYLLFTILLDKLILIHFESFGFEPLFQLMLIQLKKLPVENNLRIYISAEQDNITKLYVGKTYILLFLLIIGSPNTLNTSIHLERHPTRLWSKQYFLF